MRAFSGASVPGTSTFIYGIRAIGDTIVPYCANEPRKFDTMKQLEFCNKDVLKMGMSTFLNAACSKARRVMMYWMGSSVKNVVEDGRREYRRREH